MLEDIFVLRQAREVTEFLGEHPYLGPLLLEVYDHIQEHFGPRPRVALEVVADPEGTDDRELYALIATQLPPEAALEKLERLDKGWWLSAMDRAQCKLSIDVEFL
ncbi:MAG: hypothetical protein ACRD88_01560 [Terriglobia bacterium]